MVFSTCFQRFSNGPVWAEYLAEKFHIPNNMSHNYAYGGASSGWDNYFFPSWSGLLWQVFQYLKTFETVPDRTFIAYQAGGANDLFEGAAASDAVLENNLQAMRQLASYGAKAILFLDRWVRSASSL